MTTKDALYRLVDQLPDDEVDHVVRVLKACTGYDRGGANRSKSQPGSRSPQLRWPALGAGSIGASILAASAIGAVVGPLGAIIGAAVGLIAGDLVDQVAPARA